MGILIRAGWRALRRRLSPFPSAAAVREVLRGQAGVGALEGVEACAADNGGAVVIVTLRAAEGVDAREVASRAADRLHERLPAAEFHMHVLDRSAGA